MELKEGMYVRTHQGIAKIVEKPNISVVVWNDRKVIYVDENGHPVPTSFNFFVFEDEITVFSFNIIDLIQVGDYVNGMCVIAKDSDNRLYVAEDLGEPYYREFYNGCFDYTLLETDNFKIKDIVTKEQFNSMKYVVERDK